MRKREFFYNLLKGVGISLAGLLGTLACGAALAATDTPHYIYDVENEVSNEPVELVLVDRPEFLDDITFNEKVFNHELSREFIFKYQQTFGRTEQEENYHLVNQQGYSISAGLLTTAQADIARREFAQYMAKRLVEYHGDNIMKTDEKFKKIYEIKQAVSNVNVSVTESTKIDMMYSFVGGSSTVKVTNPTTNMIFLVSTDPGAFFSVSPVEMELMQQKNWTKTFRNELGFKFYSKEYRFSLFKDLSTDLALNFTQTLPMVAGFVMDANRESLSLAGVKFIF